MNSKTRSIWIGIGIGAILLLFISLPILWDKYQVLKFRQTNQEVLVNAAGESSSAMQNDYILITKKPESLPEQDISVSIGGLHWYSLSGGAVVLPYDRQMNNKIYIASSNRRAAVQLTASAMEDNKLEVDISIAPKSSPLVFIQDINKKVASIAVQGANSVYMEPVIPGVTAKLIENKVQISFENELQSNNFFCFRIILENENGKSFTTVAVLPKNYEEFISVSTAEEFQAIKENLSANYRLINDIDLSGFYWQPIGTPENPFTGVFDGNGYSVSGLKYPYGGEELELNSFNLLGNCQNAIIRNLCIIEPQIKGEMLRFGDLIAAALAGPSNHCLIENCAVIGGFIQSRNNCAAGFLQNAQDCVLLNLYNSAKIEAKLPANVMMDTGGIAAMMNSFMAYCANEGDVSASHLNGGLFGYGNKASVWRCINTGKVKGSVFIGEFPPGAIFQTIDDYYMSECVFVKGSASRAGSAFGGGAISDISLIEADNLQDKEALSLLGEIEGENAQWLLNDDYAKGIMPSGIRTLKLYRPGVDYID